ncbi:glucose-6-phosphate dehydrogenase [Azospirillum thermophilum]|uniref:Glucose-6-phosphate 1-dehydrogenase n=1 Tax=Azospirillum thermophilum TaxID=2202148 RepID=A0A2S2CVA4_9PROT|nr:glucose-6-phosphate dehydrogenase [Azospirillum thermophilum]AWK88454.1 glucose-6-phosphate dehydrogenase [Azospirillum thermophilum]
MVAHVVPVDPFDLIVFGATGDLARRKLIPALYHRFRDGQMPDGARVVGVARSDMGEEEYLRTVDSALTEFVEPERLDPETRRRFLSCMGYQQIDAGGELGWEMLKTRLDASDRPVRAFYLSVAPHLFEPIAARTHALGIADERFRLVVEKPFGHDLATARALNRSLSARFPETQIYRIDHYLGKETVQNLMALRFANTLFEPLWNGHHIDHVQITVAETVGITGRGQYYDGVGAMRDMVQNHLLQLLCLVAMEPPARFDPDAVRDEKLKVLRSLAPVTDPLHVVRGQYRCGSRTPSYHDEAERPDSRTESFVALRAEVSNWRWAGVPFYLRTGKRLRSRMSEIVVQFKEAPHSIFRSRSRHPGPNVLCIRLQPNEGIKLGLTIKDPGPGGMRLAPAELDMTFDATLREHGLRMPDAYERLVMDVMRGDQTLFMRGDEVEAAWAWVDPIIADWEDRKDRPHPYDPGSSGPEDALMLLHRDRRRWREIE